MDLADWLEMPVTEEDRAKPEETLWLDFAGFELPSGKLAVADPLSFHDTAVLVVLRPWRYEVQARLLVVGGERRISRVRAVRGASGGARGKLIGRVAAPSLRVGFSDYELVGAAVDALDEAARAAWLERAGPAPAVLASWDPAGEVATVLVAPGATAESFPVHELVSGDKRVGAEVVFIDVPRS